FERALKHASFPVLAGMERQYGFVEASGKGDRFFRKGRMNQWREQLSRDQIARVTNDHREQMARFKYLPPGF
ncbi:MAG: sulfotransferase protein, partial [Xanthomonadaceae bacterium]|nr:sulfotransferase protein [Xanthomonadaceae bacterium]